MTVERFMLYHVHFRAFSTLPSILASISHFHCRSYFSSPTVSRSVTRALQGAKRVFGSPSISRKIITKDILSSLYSLTLRPDASFITFRTVWRVFIEFYGLLRFSEVSQLRFVDISWTDLGFDIFIAKSKTDQTRKGDWVAVASQPASCPCPVAFTRKYLSLLPYDSGYIMPSVKKSVPDSATPLQYNTALRDLQSALRSVGIDPQGYGEHSGRRGGTTAAANSGATMDELMIQGRWRSESMPRLYTDNAVKCKRKFARRIAVA